jgi:hypothetical protein
MAVAAGIGAAGSLLGGIAGGIGAKKAAKTQAKAVKQGIAQQAGQFAVTQGNIQPWVSAGRTDLGGIQDLLGFGGSSGQGSGASPADQVRFLVANTTGKTHAQIAQWLAANPDASPDSQLSAISSMADPNERARWQEYANASPYVPAGTAQSAGQAQQAAIDNLKASPLFQSLYGTGQDTILQNAAATGGLRGGNTQNSLAQFGSGLLAQVIQQQLANLGTVSGQGAQAGLGLGQISQGNANAQSAGYNNLGAAQGAAAASPWLGIAGALQKIGGQGNSLANLFGGGGGDPNSFIGTNNGFNSYPSGSIATDPTFQNLISSLPR